MGWFVLRSGPVPALATVLMCGLLVSLAQLSGAAYDSLYDSPWPKARCDERNSGLSPYTTGHNDGTLRWTFVTGDRIHCEPIIGHDGTIYVLSGDGFLYALNSRGSELWRYEVGECQGSPAIGRDGTIYVASRLNGLYALRPGGNLAWRNPDCDGDTGVAIGADDTLYVGGRGTGLMAFASDGTEKWRIEELDGYWYGLPAIASNGNIVLAVEEARRVVEISPAGQILLEFETGGVCSYSAVLDKDGNVYVATYTFDWKGHLESYDGEGELRWQVELEQWIRGSPALGPNGEVFVMVKDAKLHAFSSRGVELWAVDTLDWGSDGPSASKDGTVFTGTREGRVVAVRDGRVRWFYMAPESIETPPAIDADGVVYVGAHDGTLYAFGKDRPVEVGSGSMASSVGLLLVIVAVIAVFFGLMLYMRRRKQVPSPQARPPPAEQPYEPWKAPSADPEAFRCTDGTGHDDLAWRGPPPPP